MNIGKLDRSLILQAPDVVAQNIFGEPAPQTYHNVATIRAERKPGTGTEAQQAEQLTVVQIVVWQARYRADVQPTWRLIYDGVIYHITAVTEIGRRVGLQLTTFTRGEKVVVLPPTLHSGFPHTFAPGGGFTFF